MDSRLRGYKNFFCLYWNKNNETILFMLTVLNANETNALLQAVETKNNPETMKLAKINNTSSSQNGNFLLLYFFFLFFKINSMLFRLFKMKFFKNRQFA